MSKLSDQIDAVNLAEEKLKVKKVQLLEKAMKDGAPGDVVKASKIITEIQQRNVQDPKSFFIDPLQFNTMIGYKDKTFSLSYETLKRMAKTPIINSILKTRKNQVANFAEPQEDKYSNGFVIRKKKKYGIEQKMTDTDKKIAFAITDFLMNGSWNKQWAKDDFDDFIRKLVDDTLTYDQMTFEVIRSRNGNVDSFQATDAATFRIADSFFDKDYENPYFKQNGALIRTDRNDWGPLVKGYRPAYVQIYQQEKISEFYPWELCFGVRNPSTSIRANGYGCSELEELINVITSMLYGDEYNRRFFSQGSAPKGLLRVKGSNNEAALQQFRQQWQSMISGVMNAWKTPVVEADIDWIDLQKNNRDMEYSAWMEYLIKIACAVYNIDPIEIGWDISRSNGNSGLFEGSEAERMEHSKDKGLYPLLKFIQRKINKYIIEPINPDFEFIFVGMNGLTVEKELEMDIKKVTNFSTLNEIREKYDLDKIEGGDTPLNSAYIQMKNAEEQRKQQQQMNAAYYGGAGGGQGEGSQEYANEEDEDAWTNDIDWESMSEEEKAVRLQGRDAIMKAFDSFMAVEGV